MEQSSGGGPGIPDRNERDRNLEQPSGRGPGIPDRSERDRNPEQPSSALADRAREVLERNRRGDWTCPSNALYPHQWLWDSCFVAIGVARHDPQRGARELLALLRGQWSNGMLPHMIFAAGSGDVGSRRIWQSRRHPAAPRDVSTSCITQPPLLAVAATHVAVHLPEAERAAFLAEMLPALLAHHRWLYRERDLHGEGLITLVHSWECGLDTTPPWMQALARVPMPMWLTFALRLHLARIVRSLRRDTRLVPANERTSDDDGLRMLVQAYRAKRHDFDARRLVDHPAVLIEDLAFNAFLAVSNRALGDIADELGQTIDSELRDCFERTMSALAGLWDESSGQYFSRDARTGEAIRVPTVATFLPLWAGVATDAQAARLIERLQDPSSNWPTFPVPSVPIDATEFAPDRYWSGPTWVNINWAIVQGLRRHGAAAVADDLRRRTLQLVEHAGFAEYFSPLTGRGDGADDFSWTAALVLDLLD